MSDCVIEMPRYQCHKQVWALKIKEVRQAQATAECEGGDFEIVPEESGYAPFRVPHSFMQKHKPEAGGYYVTYKGGYASFSPADAFEEGYVREGKLPVDVLQLMTFYDAETIGALIVEMCDHVDQLQKRLQPFLKEPHQINRVREG